MKEKVIGIKNILIQVNSFGIKERLFVLDKGFYSKKNICEMTEERIKFVIPLPFTPDISKFLIHKHQKNLSNPLNSFTFGKKLLFYSKDKIDIGGIKLVTHLYSDERK